MASEWDQQAVLLKLVQMPLMTLACTALDQTSSRPDAYRQQVLNYGLTDTDFNGPIQRRTESCINNKKRRGTTCTRILKPLLVRR